MSNMKLSIYSRVSTKKQDTEKQIIKLKEYAKLRDWEVEGIYSDTITGKKRSRPELDKILKKVHNGESSGILVWKLDRLARSVKDAIWISEYLRRHHSELIIFGSNIDTSTAEGRFFFNVTASFAELESEFISERTSLAYDAKKAHAEALGQNVRWGRKKKLLSDVELDLVADLQSKGMSLRKIADTINARRFVNNKKGKVKTISYSTLSRLLQNRGVKNGGVSNG